MSKKEAVYTAEVDGKEKKILVKLPGIEEQREGQKHYNKAFSDAVSSGAILRTKLEDFMKDQNLWDEKKDMEFETLNKEISEKEKTLAEGGIKLSEAKQVALSLRKTRDKLRSLISKRMELDVHTAEGQAENARFNYWVSSCLVYNDTKKKVFADIDDYLNNSTEDYAARGASKLAELMYDLSSDFEMSLEENSFLKEFGFINEEGHLVDDQGRLVDEEGRLVDKRGFFIDEEGNRVDIDGNPVDEKGRLKIERKPFLDDEGSPIQKDEAIEESPEAKLDVKEEPVEEESSSA